MQKLSVLLLFATCFPGAAPAAQNSRLVVRSLGQFENANTVVYSVYLASREEKLGELLISSALPPGSRFLDNVDTPTSARYEGVADNVIQWTVASLDRETLLGPFNFRVRIDPTREDLPMAPPFSVSYQSPASELLGDPGDNARLLPLAATGSITFDQRGTLDGNNRAGLLEVGKTGILVYVPEGAVDRSVTLTFTRLAVEDDKVPQEAKDTWWCGLYRMSMEPQIDFLKPIEYALPVRRGITPGLRTTSFSSADGSAWWQTTASASGAPTAKEPAKFFPGFGGFGSNCTTVPFGFTSCSSQFGGGLGGGGLGGGFGFGGFGAFGVSQTARAVGAITGAALSQQFGQPFRPSQIQDGTSNTIIAILIGLR